MSRIDLLDSTISGSHASVPLPLQWEAESRRAGLLAEFGHRLDPTVAASFQPESGCRDIVLRVRCGRGAYVRSMARDIGETLGVGGSLVRLVRTESDGFGIEDAVRVEDLDESNFFEKLAPAGIPFLLMERGMRQGTGPGPGPGCLESSLSSESVSPDAGAEFEVGSRHGEETK